MSCELSCPVQLTPFLAQPLETDQAAEVVFASLRREIEFCTLRRHLIVPFLLRSCRYFISSEHGLDLDGLVYGRQRWRSIVYGRAAITLAKPTFF
jgi:hypothetical protein